MSMRRVMVRILLCGISFILSAGLAAQPATRISGHFNNLRFPLFVREIENKIECQFYYNPAELDSVVVNVQADQLRLDELLDLAFLNTSFRFTIDSLNNVFVYNKRFTIQPKLPADFFGQRNVDVPPVDREGNDN